MSNAKTQPVSVKVDATEVAAFLQEFYTLLDGPVKLHPYYEDVVAPLLADTPRFMEVFIVRGQMHVRPSAEAMAALVSLRAARGRSQPEVWTPRPPESV
jgi:hypothetical protein